MSLPERDDIAKAAGLLGISFDLAKAVSYTYAESAAQYSQWDREQAVRHILWQSGDKRGWEPGSFSQSLLIAWDRADESNRARLMVAFPVYADAYDVRQREGVEALVAWAGIEDAA